MPGQNRMTSNLSTKQIVPNWEANPWISFKNYPWGSKPNHDSHQTQTTGPQHWDSLQRKSSINATVVKDFTQNETPAQYKISYWKIEQNKIYPLKLLVLV